MVVALFVIILAAVFFGAWTYLFKDRTTTLDPLVTETAHLKGAAGAPVSVVVFSDFLCKDCAVLARDVLPKLEAEFIETGVARLAYRHYPLDGEDALRAAIASECAAREGKFWEMHDILYGWRATGRFSAMPLELARQLAVGVGVSPRTFDRCVSDASAIGAIERDLLDGFSLGIARLPAVYVNGAYAGPAIDYTRLRALVLVAATADRQLP